MNAADFAEGVNSAEGLEVYTPAEIDDLRANGGEDWQDRIFKQAALQILSLLSVGELSDVNYFISGNYHNQDGTLFIRTTKGIILRANINAVVSKNESRCECIRQYGEV
jgi:TonB-dependent starch-binding outer membrane protein SusC